MKATWAAALLALAACDPPATLEDRGFGAAISLLSEAQARHPAPLQIAPEVLEGRPPKVTEAEAPEGYLQVTPVARNDQLGHVVMLVTADERLVPIFIGGTEALSIELRLQQRKFTRPLTHDLLDQMVDRFGGKMVRAQVDAIREGVFHGSVILAKGDEHVTFDARPSDAIALAIGNEAPIFVSESVLGEAGQSPDDLAPPRGRAPAKPAREPLKL